jgi:ABC-type taurine transport system substrate-binding protein
LTSKAAKAKIDAWKKESAEIKKLNKNSAEYKKRTADLVKDIKKHTNVQDKNNKTLKGSYNANKRLMKSEEELNKTRKQKRK